MTNNSDLLKKKFMEIATELDSKSSSALFSFIKIGRPSCAEFKGIIFP